MNTTTELTNLFGGEWTRRKHEILRRYLNAYTTALKKKRFELVYADSHSGPGIWISEDEEAMDGSPLIALKTSDSEFAELFFNDDDKQTVKELKLRVDGLFPGRQGVHYSNEDADDFLRRVCKDLGHPKRGVAFFEPYASKSSWSSMQAIAATGVLDAIILFPAAAIWRQMPNQIDSSDAHPFASNLTRFFGDDSWKLAYDAKYASELRQRHGLGGGSRPTMEGLGVVYAYAVHVRCGGSRPTIEGLGVDGRSDHELIPYIYKERLEEEFGKVHMKPVPLEVNSSAYFELIFAVSNPSPAAQGLALSIFNGVVRSLQ